VNGGRNYNGRTGCYPGRAVIKFGYMLERLGIPRYQCYIDS